MNFIFQIQMEADTNVLTIYDGGNEEAEMISILKGATNGTKIATSENQIFAVLNTNGKISLNAAVIESM